MTGKFLTWGGMAIALSLLLGACMPNLPSTKEQAQYLADRRLCPPDTHSETSAVSANGYWCVLNQ
jgi:hypothetical protein